VIKNSESSTPIETIIIVHGTFGNSAQSKASAWWWPGSHFCSNLDTALERRGLTSRCWRHVDLTHSRPLMLMGQRLTGPGTSSYPFSWSGENFESGRRQAAESLKKYFAEIEDDSRICKYHVVAHSHGGSVVARALRDMKTKPSKLGTVTFLGTPFLRFDDEGHLRNTLRRINWPTALLFVALLVLSVVYHATLTNVVRAPPEVYGVYLLIIFLGFAFMLVTYYAQTWSPIRHVPAINIVFPGDEAIGLLKKCAAVALEPHSLLHELFKDSPDLKIGRKESFISSIGRIKFVGKILEGFTMLCFIMTSRPYRPRLRLFFSSRVRGLKQSFFYFFEDWPELDTAGNVRLGIYALGSTLVASSFLLLLPIDFTLGAIDWIFQVVSRFSIWIAVRVAANTAFGVDILGAAFQLAKVADPPEYILQLPLEPEAQATALAEIGSLDPLRESVVQALQSPGIIDSVSAVKIALQGTELLHAYYYKDERVIDYIAQIFERSGKESPRA
jgi:hypothetical protein